MLTDDDRYPIAELAPVLRRAIELDPRSLARLRLIGSVATVFVRLPFAVLVSRTVPASRRDSALDLTTRADDLLGWLTAEAGQPVADPQPRDIEWRTALPPTAGWRRVEAVPDSDLRPLVQAGASALKEAAERADALLDSIVLTATDGDVTAEVPLRTVSALTRMGFLPRGGHAYVDVAGRWIRLVAEYGTAYSEKPGQSLGLV
jgi:hypothetical protein